VYYLRRAIPIVGTSEDLVEALRARRQIYLLVRPGVVPPWPQGAAEMIVREADFTEASESVLWRVTTGSETTTDLAPSQPQE